MTFYIFNKNFLYFLPVLKISGKIESKEPETCYHLIKSTILLQIHVEDD